VGNDFVFSEFKYGFLDNPRHLISKAYCQIHQKIDIATLPERLNLSQEEEEKWIVNLIRERWMGADVKRDWRSYVPTFFPLSGLSSFFACLLTPLLIRMSLG